MKKALLALSALVIIGVSCSKDESVSGPAGKTKVANARADKNRDKISQTACPHGGCHTPASNCVKMKDVVITTHRRTQLEKASESGSSAEVGNIFNSDDFADIANSLDEELLAKLQSGNYFILHNYEDDAIINYLVGNQSPISYDNMEFVIEFSK